MRDLLNFTFSEGYYDTGSNVNVPEGAFIAPSSNVVFDSLGRLHSFKGFSAGWNIGGDRSFVLDKNVVGFLGTPTTTGIGNMIQGVGKSLWFVGNSVPAGVTVKNLQTLTTIKIGGSNEATLSSTPQVARWNGTDYDKAIPVGLPEFSDADTPSLEFTTSATRSSGFEGLVQGSRSVRVARKRYDSISMATAASPVVESSEAGDSLIVTIPPTPNDLSADADNSWLLYFTYKGLGSTSTHKLFPLEIPERRLIPTGVGTGADDVSEDSFGNARYKVLSRHLTLQAQRKVEVEFNDNDLVLTEPSDDAFDLEACKFIAKLGNVMCGIGVGDDSTGFDVSYPNEYEAFPPDWRDWFAEVPVAVAPQEDMGYIWIGSANNLYIARWTGVTDGSAPVILEKISNLIGVIGESAMISVNGILYLLSQGAMPVAVSPDGQINTQFGVQVRNYLGANFNSNTKVGWDESSLTVIFACGTKAIGYQTAINKWTAPVTLPWPVTSIFSLNGSAYFSLFQPDNEESPAFKTRIWNAGNADDVVAWNVTSAFQFGQYGRALKDIIQVEAVISTETYVAPTPPSTNFAITFEACKNFSTTSPAVLSSNVPVTAAGSMVTVRSYAESLDYDTIAAKISGNRGGQTVHSAMYTIDVHSIERVS